MQQIIYIMGVAGSGKTTIGRALSEATGIPFYDGDDFHPPANVEKMGAGLPLTDADRAGWLESIVKFVRKKLPQTSLIIACSALKRSYREQLTVSAEGKTNWVWLKGDFELIRRRMEARADHFMPTKLLQSQFDTLEIPERAIDVSIDQTPEQIITYLRKKLNI